MKSYSVLATLSLLSAQVSGHYIFNQLQVGGTKFPVQQYIRPNTNYNSPITDLTSNDLRCNQGGASGSGTSTLTIAAGSSVTWYSDVAVYHNGPIAAYMAKAPSSAASFDGSGNVWFKIWQEGPTFNPVTWPLSQSYTFSLPSGLPNGDYLLRIEQIGIHNPYPAGLPQFYLECAQLTITNGGSGSPSPLVAIPGYVKGTEQGYTVNIYNSFTAYTFLGPSVWSGGGGGSPATTTRAGTTTTRAGATTTTAAQTTTSASGGSGATVPKYGQCGGQGWTGGTVCAAGSTCQVSNQFYSQCL